MINLEVLYRAVKNRSLAKYHIPLFLFIFGLSFGMATIPTLQTEFAKGEYFNRFFLLTRVEDILKMI